jgi:Fic family protein
MCVVSTLLPEIDALKSSLDGLRTTLDNATIRDALRVEFLYESNRIEGNTLTLRETQMVVNEGMTISGKSMREHLEAINHKEAVLLVEDIVAKRLPLSESVLKQLHALVLHGIDRENAGHYRRVPVLISGSRHVPPPALQVQSLMDEYFALYEQKRETVHPVVLSAELHERLVTIHPFTDGNGRTARLVMNLVLLQHGFPLAIIGGDAESRIAYYDALEQAQTAGNNEEFVVLIAEYVKAGLERYIKILA